MSLSTTVKSIQDIMRKDAGVDGDAQRISQLVWMLFLKVFDDAEAERELMEDRYKSPIPERLRWRSWAADAEGITGEALLDFVNNDLFKTLKEVTVGGKNAALANVVRGVFEDAYNYMKSGTLMRQVINKLGEIDFNKQSDPPRVWRGLREAARRPAKRRQRGRVLHPAGGHPVHGRPSGSQAGRDRP
jgi:type I restriction enzyme M protein